MRLSPEQYLEIERKADWKSEYYDGKMVEMPPVDISRNSIISSLTRLLADHLRDRTDCEPFTSQIRILTSGLFTYPDLSAVCEPARFIHAADDDTLLNPTLLFEVCSPKTESWKRGAKAAIYREAPCVRELVFVAQDRYHIEVQRRVTDGWLLTEASGPDGAIEVATIGLTLRLAEVYQRVAGQILQPEAP